MCFIVHFKHREPKIAERDIICYKVLAYKDSFNSYRSPFTDTEYTINELKEVIMGEPSHGNIEEGLHSYASIKKAGILAKRRWKSRSVFKAIIPKGSTYYYNPYHQEYVSSQLKVSRKSLRSGLIKVLTYLI